MIAEQWLPIPGFEGRYDVSDRGRVRSWVPWRGIPGPRLLTPRANPKSYQVVPLRRADGRRIQTLIHRAVLAAFVGPAPEGMPITRHLDGDPSNNHLSNLRYGTHSENELDKVRHGTHQNASKTACPNGHPYDEQNTIKEGASRRCRTCDRKRAHVRKVCPICGLPRTNLGRHIAWHGRQAVA